MKNLLFCLFIFLFFLPILVHLGSCSKCDGQPPDIESSSAKFKLVDFKGGTELIAEYGRRYLSDSVYIYQEGVIEPIEEGVSGFGGFAINPFLYKDKLDTLYSKRYFLHLPNPSTNLAHDDINTIDI